MGQIKKGVLPFRDPDKPRFIIFYMKWIVPSVLFAMAIVVFYVINPTLTDGISRRQPTNLYMATEDSLPGKENGSSKTMTIREFCKDKTNLARIERMESPKDQAILDFIKCYHLITPKPMRKRESVEFTIEIEAIPLFASLDPGKNIPIPMETVSDGEDAWRKRLLALLFQNKNSGFFVEYNPSLKSLPFGSLLDKKDWEGLVFEQDPKKLVQLTNFFPNAWLSNGCLSPHPSVQRIGKTHCFNIISFLSALNKTRIDFLSLGNSESPWEIIRPLLYQPEHVVDVIDIEHGDLNEVEKNRLGRLIESHGYNMMLNSRKNVIFRKICETGAPCQPSRSRDARSTYSLHSRLDKGREDKFPERDLLSLGILNVAQYSPRQSLNVASRSGERQEADDDNKILLGPSRLPRYGKGSRQRPYRRRTSLPTNIRDHHAPIFPEILEKSESGVKIRENMGERSSKMRTGHHRHSPMKGQIKLEGQQTENEPNESDEDPFFIDALDVIKDAQMSASRTGSSVLDEIQSRLNKLGRRPPVDLESIRKNREHIKMEDRYNSNTADKVMEDNHLLGNEHAFGAKEVSGLTEEIWAEGNKLKSNAEFLKGDLGALDKILATIKAVGGVHGQSTERVIDLSNIVGKGFYELQQFAKNHAKMIADKALRALRDDLPAMSAVDNKNPTASGGRDIFGEKQPVMKILGQTEPSKKENLGKGQEEHRAKEKPDKYERDPDIFAKFDNFGRPEHTIKEKSDKRLAEHNKKDIPDTLGQNRPIMKTIGHDAHRDHDTFGKVNVSPMRILTRTHRISLGSPVSNEPKVQEAGLKEDKKVAEVEHKKGESPSPLLNVPERAKYELHGDESKAIEKERKTEEKKEGLDVVALPQKDVDKNMQVVKFVPRVPSPVRNVRIADAIP